MRIVRTVVRYELGIWRSLAVWLLRLRRDRPGIATFSYAGVVTPLLIAFIVVSAIELPILHFLLPWETVRLIADIVSVWGLVWMIGLLAAMRVHPHEVGPAGIRIRGGFTVDVTVPWSAIASVRSRGRGIDGRGTVHYDQSSGVLAVVTAKQTTVDLILQPSSVLDLPQTGGEAVAEVRLYADDPGAFVAAVRERLAAAAQ